MPLSWLNDPEAFSEDYAELQALFQDAEEEPILEGDLFDIVKQHDESEE